MNKRGQIYILAAVVLIVIIWGVVKVVNKVEGPDSSDNFDFYVENFAGERAYVMDLGFVEGDPFKRFLDGDNNDQNLLELFAEKGFNTGIVFVVYEKRKAGGQENSKPWKIVNYLGQSIEVCDSDCDDKSILKAENSAAGGLSFSFGENRKFFVDETSIGDIGNKKFYIAEYDEGEEVVVKIEGNVYTFSKPKNDDKNKRVESILFKNLDDDYVKVVRI